MEALAAFSLVCNVIQVVDLGLKTISKCREIALNGSTKVNLDVQYVAGHLQDLSKELQTSLGPDPPTGGSPGDRQMRDLAKTCEKCAVELSLKLKKLQVAKSQNKVQVFKKMVENLWKRRELEDLENRLERLRRTLDSRILARLW